jgi:hypothetical protein
MFIKLIYIVNQCASLTNSFCSNAISDTELHVYSDTYTRKNLTTCQQDVFATGFCIAEACQQVV